jgi:hypothetical protein
MGKMPMEYSDLLSTIALCLSISSFVLVLWDRRPRLKVGIEKEFHVAYEETLETEVPLGNRLWIYLANHAQRKMFISHMILEWSHYRWLPISVKISELDDLQPGEEGRDRVQRFWIEPWADAIFSVDIDEIEFSIKKICKRRRVWYSLVVYDGLGRKYRSKKIRFKVK